MRDTKLLMDRREDYRLYATVQVDKSEVEGIEKKEVRDVLCRVYIPIKVTDTPLLHFYLTDEQAEVLEHPSVLSVLAEMKQPNGSIDKISASEVRLGTMHGTRWGPHVSDNILIGEPLDLKVEHVLQGSKYHPESRTRGAFWLTPSKLLDPMNPRMTSYTGDVSIERKRRPGATLANGTELIFDVYTRYREMGTDETLMFTELVAEFEINEDTRGTTKIDEIIPYLDDYLLLVSFVMEQRCVCLGYEASDSDSVTRFYRRSVVPPRIKEVRSMHDALVDVGNFKEFIRAAYQKFYETGPNAGLRRAIHYVIPDENDTIETSFIMLYAALETLVLNYRQQQGLGKILTNKKFKTLQEGLETWLRGHELLASEPEKSEQMIEKLLELNRVSFATAFNKFCETYGVDLSDLWPVIGNEEGDSLSKIRNKLVHGETFEETKYGALIGAGEHLRWTVYRMIFALLGWPVSRTKISPEYLTNDFIHKTMKEDRATITS